MEGMHQLSLLEIYEHTLIKAWGLCLLSASRGPGAYAALSVSRRGHALLWPRPAGQPVGGAEMPRRCSCYVQACKVIGALERPAWSCWDYRGPAVTPMHRNTCACARA